MGHYEPPGTRPTASVPQGDGSGTPLVRILAIAGAAVIALWVAKTLLVEPKPAWRRYSPPDSAFKVMMPARVKSSTDKVSTAIGPIVQHMHTAETRKWAYLVGYADYPADIVARADVEKMLDGSRDGALQNVSGKLLSEEHVTLGEYHGRDITADATKGGQQASMRARVFLVRNRLYMLIVVAPRGKISEPDVQKFFSSFEI